MVTKKTTTTRKDAIKKNPSKKASPKKEKARDSRKEVLKSIDMKRIRENLKKTFLATYIDIDTISDDILGEHFLDFAESYSSSDFKDSEEYWQYFCKYLMVQLKDSIDKKYPFESSLLDVMDKKEQETKLWNVMKAFDYLWWIIVVRAIVIVFKWYSDAGEWRRIIMWLYLIRWVISVIRSVSKNTDVAKNTNKLMRHIINARRMLHKWEDLEKVEEELDLQKILESRKE